MNEFIEVLKEEHQRQVNWFKTRFNNWLANNSYDYSKTMPRNYVIPKPMLDKAIKWYQILFICGIIIALI